MTKTLQPTKFKVLLAVIIAVGLGICVHIEIETNYITKINNVILPIIAAKSFYNGCITGSKGDVEFCNQMREAYKYEILSISKIEG